MPAHPSLSKEKFENVLESHLFLKQKRDETIKGKMVAGGNKQRGTIDKEDAASQTAALESVLLTYAIDAAEERDVAVIDVLNAFIHNRFKNNEDRFILSLRVKLADLLIKKSP